MDLILLKKLYYDNKAVISISQINMTGPSMQKLTNIL